MDLTYKLGGEQIYQKVGEHCELQYPNKLFVKLFKLAAFFLTIVLVIILLIRADVHLAIFVLHVDFIILVAIVVFIIQVGRDWLNTLIVCIDTIFVIEEVIRRKKTTRMNTDYDNDNQVSYTLQRRNVAKEEIPVKNDSPGFLDVDMNKLNKALQGNFKIV